MLAAGTWILLLTTAVISATYFFMKTFARKRRPGEPPIVKGSLIWGSAGDFNLHAVDFLHKCTKSLGSCFTMRLINQYVTIIQDPQCYEAMSREKNFDFDPIQKQVNLNVFSFVLKDPETMIKETGKTVRGNMLLRAIDGFVDNLNLSCSKFSKPIENGEWQSSDIRALASDTMFKAIFNSIFGKKSDDDAFNSSMAHKNFDTFHKYFNFFWLGLPKCLFPAAMKALEDLLVMPTHEELMARDDISDYLRTTMSFMKSQDQSEADIKSHNLVYLHVNYNTYRLSFWALSNLLEDEKAHSHLLEEVNNAIYEKLDPETNEARFTLKEVESLKVLDSFVNETMRLASGVFMVRGVVEDTWFTTSDGKKHLVRKGDRVAMYPPAIHKDPEVFEDPLVFKYDRFVDTSFYKNGVEVKSPVMSFGTLCPGKRLATFQLKWYIMTALTRFDMRLQANQHAEYAYEYHGHEVLPPKRPVGIDYKLKADFPVLKFTY